MEEVVLKESNSRITTGFREKRRFIYLKMLKRFLKIK